MLRFNILVCILFACVFSSQAQLIEVSGKVFTFDSIPIMNAKVLVQSSKEMVKTNKKGEFNCTCEIKDKLIISAKGFNRQRVKVGQSNSTVVVNLALRKDLNAEEVAIESGHITMLDSFRELAKKHSNRKDYSQYNSVLDIIRNEFSNVQISNGEIIIRGPSSINGSNAANIEVDGVITGYSVLESMSTSNIQSIRIVKGSDAAIYGMRGGNGVVCITTKKGK